VSGSGISCAIYKSTFHPKQITTPSPHNSVFTDQDALTINSIKALKAADTKVFLYTTQYRAVLIIFLLNLLWILTYIHTHTHTHIYICTCLYRDAEVR